MVQPGGVEDVRGVEADRFGNPSFWYCWPGAAQKKRGDMLSMVAILVCFFLLLSLLSHCCNYNRAQLIDGGKFLLNREIKQMRCGQPLKCFTPIDMRICGGRANIDH